MSYVVVSSTAAGDTYYSGHCYFISSQFAKKQTDAIQFNELEDATNAMNELREIWDADTLLPDIGIRFWVEDTNKPKFAGNISSLDNL